VLIQLWEKKGVDWNFLIKGDPCIFCATPSCTARSEESLADSALLVFTLLAWRKYNAAWVCMVGKNRPVPLWKKDIRSWPAAACVFRSSLSWKDITCLSLLVLLGFHVHGWVYKSVQPSFPKKINDTWLGHVYACFVEELIVCCYYGRNQMCPAMESIAWDVIRCPALVFTCCQFGKKLVHVQLWRSRRCQRVLWCCMGLVFRISVPAWEISVCCPAMERDQMSVLFHVCMHGE
jgi:hypothetical protein